MKTLLDLENMRLEKDDKMAWVTFTRTSSLNAMNNSATVAINRIAMALREDPNVRVVVVRGEGRAFSTGIDLKELADNQIDMSYHHRWEAALRIFETMEKIVVAGIHGYCLGGALQLALACDIRVSTPDCQIGLPAIKESLIPGMSPWRLPKYVGWGRAKQLILGGKNISGQDALQIGLVDHIAAAEDFFSHVDEIAGEYLKACSTGMRMSKLLINKAFDAGFDETLRLYFDLQERAQYSMDAENSKRAYLSNEEPSWQ